MVHKIKNKSKIEQEIKQMSDRLDDLESQRESLADQLDDVKIEILTLEEDIEQKEKMLN